MLAAYAKLAVKLPPLETQTFNRIKMFVTGNKDKTKLHSGS